MSTEGSSGGRASGLPRPLMDGMSRSRSTGSEDRLSLGSPSLGGMGNGMAGTPGVGQGPSGPHPSKLGHSRDGSTDQLEGQYPYVSFSPTRWPHADPVARPSSSTNRRRPNSSPNTRRRHNNTTRRPRQPIAIRQRP